MPPAARLGHRRSTVLLRVRPDASVQTLSLSERIVARVGVAA
jgi:hypothetical protein